MDIHLWKNTVDIATKNFKVIREEKLLKDTELKKIMECFESNFPATDLVKFTEIGYLMNQGVLYKYAPDPEVKVVQLVAPTNGRKPIVK